MELYSFCGLSLLSLKFFLRKATRETLNITLICVVEGWMCISGWSETHSGATFKVCQSTGAPRQSSLSTNWSNPLGSVYLNETLRPWGVCWGEVRNAKYRFVFFLFYLPLSFWLFSFLSQPFSFMIQKSLVNIPARQLYWALQRPPPPHCTEFSGSQHSSCDMQLFTYPSFPNNHLVRLLSFGGNKKKEKNNNSKPLQNSSTSGDFLQCWLPKRTICFDIVSLQWNFSHNNMCFVKI